jgi:5-methylcytosine-specific restriction endonuclease McrA
MKLKVRLTKRLKTLRKHQGNQCCWCGQPMQRTDPQAWDYETLEHLTPLSKGGSHHISNLALAHRKCNQARGSEDRQPRYGVRKGSRAPASSAVSEPAPASACPII